MTFTIGLGWWLAPAAVTLVIWFAAITCIYRTSGQWLSGAASAFFVIQATLLSVIAWLTWGVLA